MNFPVAESQETLPEEISARKGLAFLFMKPEKNDKLILSGNY